MSGPMAGARIGITAARRAAEQAALVRSLGGEPVVAPTVDIDRPAPDAELAAALARLVAAPPDIVVVMTGVGIGHLLRAAERAGTLPDVLAALAAARVIVRGTKPRRVVREFGVAVDWMAAPPEGQAILARLRAEGIAGRRILLQCAGAEPDPITPALRAAGCEVTEVHPYAIALPPDAHPAADLARAAIAGELAALTFTSAQAVHGFTAIAERAGLDPGRLAAGGALVVAVGPVTRAALERQDLPVHVEPAIPRMGAMYRELATALRAVRSRGSASSH